MNETGVYLYCFAAPPVTGPAGVEVWLEAETAAIVKTVPLADFAGPEAEARLQDPQWVVPRALEHEQVLEQIAGQTAVWPVAFGTLFESRASLARFVGQHRAGLTDFLAQAATHEEWSVKVLGQPSEARQAVWAELCQTEGTAALSPGRRYFAEQQLRSQADKMLRQRLHALCREVVQELSALGWAGRERRADARNAPEGFELLAHQAYFVPRSESANFHLRVAGLHAGLLAQGLSLQVSGPWPPYSFVPPLS
jgi:hypothetical protein